MKKIIVSKKPNKCRKCDSLTYKIEYKNGPNPEKFLLTINQLMCARCGYIYTGEMNSLAKKEIEISDVDYQKMLNQHKNFKKKGYIEDKNSP